MNRDAEISSCGKYRYWLTRDWSESDYGRRAIWVMLNPSTADAKVDDPTIRRCMGFAKREGYDGIAVYNLFAFRATNPKDLLRCSDPITEKNLDTLRALADTGATIHAAWGGLSKHLRRLSHIQRGYMLNREGPTLCLGTTKGGNPRHPLYVKGDTQFVKIP